MRIEVDRAVYIGSGMCVMTEPGMFDQDEDGVVVMVGGEVPDELADTVIRAVAACPSGTIRRVG